MLFDLLLLAGSELGLKLSQQQQQQHQQQQALQNQDQQQQVMAAGQYRAQQQQQQQQQLQQSPRPHRTATGDLLQHQNIPLDLTVRPKMAVSMKQRISQLDFNNNDNQSSDIDEASNQLRQLISSSTSPTSSSSRSRLQHANSTTCRATAGRRPTKSSLLPRQRSRSRSSASSSSSSLGAQTSASTNTNCSSTTTASSTISSSKLADQMLLNTSKKSTTTTTTTLTPTGGSGKKSSASGANKSLRAHLCNECGRTFSRSDMLTRHSRLHSGLKPYQCGKCKQVFSRSDHLSTHERTHTGEKPYQCQQCSYSACRRDMITRHMRTHANNTTRGRTKRPSKAGRWKTKPGTTDGTTMSPGKRPMGGQESTGDVNSPNGSLDQPATETGELSNSPNEVIIEGDNKQEFVIR